MKGVGVWVRGGWIRERTCTAHHPFAAHSPFVPCGGGFVDGVWIFAAFSKKIAVADRLEPVGIHALVTLAGGGSPP